ncbi:hypothetical protein M885DRAFT_103855 [Pelagophyceae sp. CCMP2097]|nr:hypothetical protein M885DRAFT_103855 [Pelagophyceae sp. CCMP2097]
MEAKSVLRAGIKARQERQRQDLQDRQADGAKRRSDGAAYALAQAERRSPLVTALEAGLMQPADVLGPLGGFRALSAVRSAGELLRSQQSDETSKPLYQSQSLRQFELAPPPASSASAAATAARSAAAAAEYRTPTDRIARMYTNSARGITMKDAQAVSKVILCNRSKRVNPSVEACQSVGRSVSIGPSVSSFQNRRRTSGGPRS